MFFYGWIDTIDKSLFSSCMLQVSKYHLIEQRMI